MADRLREADERWEDRYVAASQHPFRTALKWALGFMALIVCIAVIWAVVSWIGSWGGEAARITSPDNVREQNTTIIDDWENLDAAAQNVCQVRDAAKQDGDPTLVEDPALAYKATYRRIAADYNRRMANLYEAQAVRHLPLPSNLRSYPPRAPSLNEKLAEVC